MPQKTLSLETIGALDQGAAALIINRAIKEAVDDVDDRGEDGKDRKVTIVISLKRQPNGYVHTRVEAAAQVPKRSTHETVATLRRQAQSQSSDLLFQEFAPESPDQETLPFDASNER